MTNQTVGTGSTGDFLYSTRVLLFVAFLSMGYVLSRPKPDKEQDQLLLATTEPASQDKEWAGIQPWQREASEKAIERYAGSQEKKWRRWNESMFERSG
ncbi:hypothetical protein ACFLY3_00540 [Chloroflexota bacterium]